jgi:APA family basic amino acid/polyamine antiporter
MPLPSNPSTLRRIVSLGFGVAIIVGGTIGVGIMRMPAIVAGYTSNPFLFIFFWILGGFIAMVGASVYAELGTRMPYAGGPFVFAQKAFGNDVGFLTGCCDWFFQTGAMSYLSIAIAEYINRLMSWNLPLGISASLLTIVFVLFQWQGLKSSSNFQKIMSVITSLGLLLFVGACFVHFFKNSPGEPAGPHVVDTLPVMAIFVLSIRSVFMTFTGWNCAVYFVEEDTDPLKNLPRALFTGVASVTIIFALINLGLLAVLPLPVMAQTNLPAADAAQVIFGGSGGSIVTIISIVSLIACLAATALVPQRILFAMSRRGLFFRAFSVLNKHQIPGNALLLTAGISIIFSLTGIFNVVVNVAALFALLADLLVYVSIIFVRRKESEDARKRVNAEKRTAEAQRREEYNNLSGSASHPEHSEGTQFIESHYHAWAYPFGPLFMIAVSLSLTIGLCIEDTRNCLYAVGILSVTFPFYFVFKRLEVNRNR